MTDHRLDRSRDPARVRLPALRPARTGEVLTMTASGDRTDRPLLRRCCSLITKPLGAYMARVFEGERTLLHPSLGWLERGTYRVLGVDPEDDMKWTTYASPCWCSRFARLAVHLRAAAPAGLPAAQPAALRRQADDAGPRVQHRDVVHDQHQLAELLAGGDDLLLLEHGGARHPQLGVGGGRDRGRHRGGARLRPRTSVDGLGNFWVDIVRATLYVLLPICARRRARVRRAGRAAELRAVHGRDDPRGRQADHRPGAGRLAGDHQAARHQRRRLLQRQLGASLREPDAARPTSSRCS